MKIGNKLLCPDEDHAANEHAGSYSDICNDALLNILIVINVKHKLGSDIGRCQVLLEIELLFLSELEIIHILKKLLDMFKFQCFFDVMIGHI